MTDSTRHCKSKYKTIKEKTLINQQTIKADFIWRVYSIFPIPFQASRATSCTALTRLEEELFISSGGSRGWVKEVPAKLKKLEEINLLLCSNPRLLTTSHIKV